MSEEVNVKFRWFRTIDTQSKTVHLISVGHKWDAVELHWHKLNFLYESVPTHITCARHDAVLIVDNEPHDCKGFTVVSTTFEVNIFLVNVDSNCSARNSLIEHFPRNDIIANPFTIGANWSSHSPCELAFTPRSPVYEEALAAKAREIDDLKTQLGQLKSALVAFGTENYSRSADDIRDSTTDFDIKTKELTRIPMVDSSDDDDDSSLNTRLCIEQEPADLERQMKEIRSLRKALGICCQKNKELSQELFDLRAENARLNRNHAHDADRRPCSVDVCCFSDPESNSTQYRRLPLVRSFASLPAMLGSTKTSHGRKVHTQGRRIGHRQTQTFGRLDFAASSDSDSGSLCTDDLLSYATPPLAVESAGVQTDITALAGKPKRLVRRRLFTDKPAIHVRTNASKSKPWKFKTVPRQYDDDSDDTEELLLEADRFVHKVLGTGDLELLFDKVHVTTRRLDNARATSTLYAGFSSITYGANQRVRPFIPKSPSDLHIGHSVRYIGPAGLVAQGKVTFVGPLMDRDGDFIGIESQGESRHSPNITYVTFKKIIFACESCY